MKKLLITMRWAVWGLTLILLYFAGANLWHLKNMELFLLVLAVGCLFLAFFFRIARNQPSDKGAE